MGANGSLSREDDEMGIVAIGRESLMMALNSIGRKYSDSNQWRKGLESQR